MPDYNPNRGPGEGPMRRPVLRVPPVRRYGPGGLPTEGADPPPKVHPLAPWIALIFVVGFLCLQLYPATHFRHYKDPSKSWVEIHRTPDGIDHEKTWQNALDVWLGGQQRETIARTETHEDGDLKTDVQVVLATDEEDLRPLAVVINSTISNAKYPERIKFHLVIPASANELEYFKLTSFFPKASIEIVSKGIDLEKISELITYRKDSKAREELKSPYNFGLYYLPKLLKEKDIDKFIYLDTDVVVKGDLGELYRERLEGRPVAAVQDCSQLFATYFDFKQLKQIQTREEDNRFLPTEPFHEDECVFNRGVLLIDVKQWIEQNVTEKIEWWMKEFSNAGEHPLYRYGQSQPPYMLALYKNYKVLTHDWNIRGLGRNKFSQKEMVSYAEQYGREIQRQPFISQESDYAKILHFNGAYKPWKRGRERLPDEDVVSLCGEKRQECYKMWWEYLDESADAKLRGSAE